MCWSHLAKFATRPMPELVRWSSGQLHLAFLSEACVHPSAGTNHLKGISLLMNDRSPLCPLWQQRKRCSKLGTVHKDYRCLKLFLCLHAVVDPCLSAYIACKPPLARERAKQRLPGSDDCCSIITGHTKSGESIVFYLSVPTCILFRLPYFMISVKVTTYINMYTMILTSRTSWT